MHSVDIYVEFTGPGPKLRYPVFSWLVSLVERTKYSHVLLRFKCPYSGQTLRYEASGTQTNFRGELSSKDRYTVYESFKFTITLDEYEKLISFCYLNSGISYGYAQILGIALNRLLPNFITTNLLSSGKKAYVCSELVTYFFKDVLKYHISLDPDLAGPRDIKDYLLNNFAHLKVK